MWSMVLSVLALAVSAVSLFQARQANRETSRTNAANDRRAAVAANTVGWALTWDGHAVRLTNTSTEHAALKTQAYVNLYPVDLAGKSLHDGTPGIATAGVEQTTPPQFPVVIDFDLNVIAKPCGLTTAPKPFLLICQVHWETAEGYPRNHHFTPTVVTMQLPG